MLTSEQKWMTSKSEITRSITIPSGIFSRFYPLADGQCASVAYHTPSQSIAFFENNSAEAWQITQQLGTTDEALNKMAIYLFMRTADFILPNSSAVMSDILDVLNI